MPLSSAEWHVLLVSCSTLAKQVVVKAQVPEQAPSIGYIRFVTTYEQLVAVAEITRGRGPWASVKGEQRPLHTKATTQERPKARPTEASEKPEIRKSANRS